MVNLERLDCRRPLLGLVASILLAACDAGSGGGAAPGASAGSTDPIALAGVTNVEEALAANREPVPLSDFTPALGFALPARGSLSSSSALAGGDGGSAFGVDCPPGNVLAGIEGRGGEVIDRIGASCVEVDEGGRWVGEPSPGGASFGGEGGTAFARTCARDRAVTGLGVGTRGELVGGIEVMCARLDGPTGTQGAPASLPRAGGDYPDVTNVACPSGAVATGLAGAGGTYLDRIGLQCRERAARAGRWTNPIDWPLIAIHAVSTPDGKVLTYGTGAEGPQGAQFIYDVWDPAGGTSPSSHDTLENTLAVDLFCGAAVVMPDDGNVLMAGGDARPLGRINAGIQDATIFDTASSRLARAADMGTARWYPTATTLPDGEILLAGGIDGGRNPAITPEIYSPAENEWRSLLGASMRDKDWFYPRQWVAPDGRVFGVSNRQMYFIDPTGAGSIENAGILPPTSFGNAATAAMYRPGKILQVGGNGADGRGAVVIDINGSAPSVRETAPMSESRTAWAEMQVLPDGTVLVLGGSPRPNEADGASRTPELWDPATETWTALSGHQWPRLYHSTSVLLQDGRVLLAGGGSPGPFLNLNAELFSPPYLFDAEDNPRRRPAIVSAPDQAAYAERITVGYEHASDVERVTLLKSSAVTHSVNMEQRFLELSFSVQDGGQGGQGGQGGKALSVTLPADAEIATPGHYLLFLLDAAGTPSEGHILKVGTEPSLAVPPTVSTPPDNTGLDANLIVNGGFESGLANWTLCADAASVSIGTGSSTGTRALDTGNGACLYQEFGIRPGERYEVRCDARSNEDAYASLSLIMQDAAYTALDSTVSVVTGSDYRNYGGRVSAPDGASIGALTLYAEGPGAFDSCIVSLVGDPGPGPGAPTDPDTPPDANVFVPVAAERDILENGSFEAGEQAWSECADDSLSRPTDDAARGDGALEIADAGCLYQEFATQPGERYRMQCRAKSEGSRYTSISFQVTDEKYTDLAADSLPVGEDRFQTYSADLTAPAGSALGAVTLYSEDIGVFDDCSVERL